MKYMHPDEADVSNADDEGCSLPAHQWILHSNTNNLSACLIRNFIVYIKMEGRGEKIVCVVAHHSTSCLHQCFCSWFPLQPTFSFYFFNRNRKTGVWQPLSLTVL